MPYLEDLLPEFRKGAKIRRKDWDKGKYIVCNGSFVYNDLDRIHSITNSDIVGDVWEFYKEPEPDWDYIIKNKCLCWFWDDNEKSKTLKFLTNIHMGAEYRFNGFWPVHGNCTYKHCRPVRRDEVTFYEERKDENIRRITQSLYARKRY